MRVKLNEKTFQTRKDINATKKEILKLRRSNKPTPDTYEMSYRQLEQQNEAYQLHLHDKRRWTVAMRNQRDVNHTLSKHNIKFSINIIPTNTSSTLKRSTRSRSVQAQANFESFTQTSQTRAWHWQYKLAVGKNHVSQRPTIDSKVDVSSKLWWLTSPKWL